MNDAAEQLAFARGVALALTWADHRCECGAGRWGALSAAWVQCAVCEMAIPVAEIADDVIEGRVPVPNLTSVKLPALGGDAARAESRRRYGR